MAAEEFIHRIVRKGARAEVVVVGYNFRFGKGRAGDVNLLQEAGAQRVFEVRIIEPQFFGDERVSSSDIRRRLGEGMVEEAAKLLGRCHLLEGEVVRGEGRGRKIGIPTANLDYPPILVPAKGVYACWAQLDGKEGRRLPAVTNIGDRPTFGGNGLTVEAHLLEGGGDLYGRKLRVEFVSRLREERKFLSPEALLAQIRVDVEEGRRRLEPESNPG
jgi:riboflavin kinase/FMN adenylyltransferase